MKHERNILLNVVILVIVFGMAGVACAAPMGTAFTYQGGLNDAGEPAEGPYDFEFSLYNDPNVILGNQVGNTVTIEDANVVDGSFAVKVDFWTDIFTGDARWLEIAVRDGTSIDPCDFVTLSPRQELTPSPYALALPGLWTQQNSISTNLVGGYTGNSVTAGSVGATISGGGDSSYPNKVTDDYGTVGGGRGNQVGDDAGSTVDAQHATVGGGSDNTASGGWATVGGGYNNNASGSIATVPGGSRNVAGGSYSFAAGYRAKVRDAAASLDGNGDEGTFVWADSTDADFQSTGPDQFLIRASGGVGIGDTAPDGEFEVNPDGTEDNGDEFVVAASGNVGIGTTNPSEKLDVNGKVSASAYTGGSPVIFEAPSGTERMRITDAGNVGIGTTGPVERLEVAGGTRAGQAPSTLTTCGSMGMNDTIVTVPAGGTSGYPSSGTLLIDDEAMTYTGITSGAFTGLTRGVLGTSNVTHSSGTTVNNYLETILATSTDPRMVVTGRGNVGIGTAAPDSEAKLDVVATGEEDIAMIAEATHSTGDTTGIEAVVLSPNGVAGVFWNEGGGMLLRGEVGPDLTSTTAFSLDGDGDLWLAGNLSAFGSVDANDINAQGNGYIGGDLNVAGFLLANTINGLNVQGNGSISGILNCYSDVAIAGNLNVTGSVSKGSGSFKIDHPLDPANKYLSHSFVESPDMMNVYNGNVKLDENGGALIELPEYFEALNVDFRYQLTCIGGFAPVYIAQEISNNHFKIAGGESGMKVSWQVTGIRQDPYAVANRIKVEDDKPVEARGSYLHPEAYGLPKEKSIETAYSPQPFQAPKVSRKVGES